MNVAYCKNEYFIQSLQNAKGLYLPDCGFLALLYQPAELTYVHILFRVALCSCHRWSSDPVGWQTELACGFPEKEKEILPLTQNQALGKK